MKYLFSVLIVLAMVFVASAQQTTFYNNANYEIPPRQGVIDAKNFVNDNGGLFIVTNPPNAVTLQAFPYTTFDTLNYTNRGRMIGVPGFDFEYFPTAPSNPQPGVPFTKMAANFANLADGLGGGIISANGNGSIDQSGFTFSVLVNPKIIISATNIVDSGLISIDNTGLIDLRGDHLDLRRAQFTMSSGVGGGGYNILDWGSAGTNAFAWFPAFDLTPTTARSSTFLSQNFFFDQMDLTNSTPYFQSLNPGIGANGTRVWRGIFLQDNSPPNVTKNVYFDNFGDGSGAFHIEWVGAVNDPVNGSVFTNYFYLDDEPVSRRSTNFSFTVPPDSRSQAFGEFTLSGSTTRRPNLPPPTPSGYVNVWPFAVTNNFAYINAQPSSTTATNGVLYSVTNVLGRIQLSASQTMNLANTRITGPNYLSISAPVDFQGNSNSLISSAFADLNLGVTGGLLTLSNLLNPNIPVWTGITNAPNAVFSSPMGGLQVWSGSFIFLETNLLGDTITNDVRILLVNSALQPTGPALQQDVRLRTGNNKLVISDELNIYRTFSSDAQILTLTTNGSGAFSMFGQLNLLSENIFWSTALPNLQFLTNWGKIETQNLTLFAGNSLFDPYSDPNAATPYQAFVNHGIITNQGAFIRANWFENSGVIAAGQSGSMDIVVSTATATNGSFLAPGGYVSISANSLIASNGVIVAGGGPLTLTTPCSLSDGYVFGNQFSHIATTNSPGNIVTNGNTWVTSGGIRIPIKPPVADLLGTTLTNIALNNFESINQWSGEDRGCSVLGFADNLALGRMILSADSTSEFTFVGATGNNALYVDSLEFQDFVTNTTATGDFPSIVIQPGMKIYYAQALMNGVSIAEKLNGKNGGGFCWVSNYAGVYSSTNLTYSDGNTYIFNQALVQSCDINSGGSDGTHTNAFDLPNCSNPEPIPTNSFFDIVVTGPNVCGGGSSQGSNNGTDNGNGGANSGSTIGTLSFPVKSSGSGSGSVSFAVAQGSYNGLFYETNGVKPSSSGYFSAKLTSKGGFTARVQIGSGIYSFSGQIDSSGHWSNNSISGKGLPPLKAELQIADNNQIVGEISGQGWSAQLLADRAAFSSKNQTRWAGKKTVLFPANEESSTTSVGDGFGTVTISSSGGVQWSGTMADGTAVSQKSALSKDGVWPLYASLYGGSGSFIGWMQFTNRSGSDIEGSALWIMPAGNRAVYPSGLTNQLDAIGSRISGSLGFSKGKTVLSGGNLDSSLTNSVNIFGNTVQSSNSSLKLSVNPQTGLFSGSVVDSNSGQNLSFRGALLEKSGIGAGFFMDADQSGKIYLGPVD